MAFYNSAWKGLGSMISALYSSFGSDVQTPPLLESVMTINGVAMTLNAVQMELV